MASPLTIGQLCGRGLDTCAVTPFLIAANDNWPQFAEVRQAAGDHTGDLSVKDELDQICVCRKSLTHAAIDVLGGGRGWETRH